MALPNNRRIFDMAAHAWKQAKTILTVPLEMPENWFKLIDSLTFHGHSSVPATFSTEVSVTDPALKGEACRSRHDQRLSPDA